MRQRSKAPEGAAAPATAASSPARSLDGLRRAPAGEAWAELAAPLRKGQGVRVLFFGITQYGKTTSVRDFLAYLEREGLVELMVVHDIKFRRPQYKGEIIHEADELYTRPPEKVPATFVLRKRDVDHIPSVEIAAKVCFEGAYDGTRTCLVVDEFHWALKDGGDHFDAPHVRRIFCEAAGMGGSIIATKQLPQHTPTEAIGQSKLVFHKQAPKVLKFMVRQGTIDERDVEIISSLDVGEFVVLEEETSFNGVIYETPKPTKAVAPVDEEAA